MLTWDNMIKKVPPSPLLSVQLLYSNLGKRRSHSGSIYQHYNYLWPPDQRLPFPSPPRSSALTRYHIVNSQFMSRTPKYFYSSSVKTFSSHIHNFSSNMTFWWIFPLRSDQMCCVKGVDRRLYSQLLMRKTESIRSHKDSVIWILNNNISMIADVRTEMI